MAVGDLVLNDNEFEYAATRFGGCGTTGIDLFAVTTGFDMPSIRSGDVERPRDHGMLGGTDFLSSRTIDITLSVFGAQHSASDLETKLRSLALATAQIGAVEQPLVFQIPGQSKRRINARPRYRNFPVDRPYLLAKMVTVMLRFVATDPRIYDNTLTTVNLNLPAASGGLVWPIVWPVSWGSASSGQGVFNNIGTFPTNPVVTFFGPLTSPNIQNMTTGEVWASSFDLQNGDQLIVDFGARTVLLNGTASRYSYVNSSSVWFTLGPGNTTLQVGAAAGTGSASVSARSAWM